MNAFGKKRLEKIYDLADVYHSDNIERVSDDFIREADIESGNFDNVKDCSYSLNSQIVQGEIILWKTAVNGCIQSGNGVIVDLQTGNLAKKRLFQVK